MKQGRGRQYINFGDIDQELAYLQELRLRADDLVNDLDDVVKSTEHNGHSIGALFKHMISAEVSWFSQLVKQQTAVIPTRVKHLDQYARIATASFSLGDAIEVGPFRSVDELIRHLQWHWTYHSAQIGMLRRALDVPYTWQFAD